MFSNMENHKEGNTKNNQSIKLGKFLNEISDKNKINISNDMEIDNKTIKISKFLKEICDTNEDAIKLVNEVSDADNEKSDNSNSILRKSKRQKTSVERYVPTQEFSYVKKSGIHAKTHNLQHNRLSKNKRNNTKNTKGIKIIQSKDNIIRNRLNSNKFIDLFVKNMTTNLFNKIFSNDIHYVSNYSDRIDTQMNKANYILLSKSLIIKSSSMYIINYPIGQEYRVMSYPQNDIIHYVCNCQVSKISFSKKNNCEHILAVVLLPIYSYMTESFTNYESYKPMNRLTDDLIIEQLGKMKI